MKILLGNLGTNKNDYKNLKVENGNVYVEKNDKTNLIASFHTLSGFMSKIGIPIFDKLSADVSANCLGLGCLAHI